MSSEIKTLVWFLVAVLLTQQGTSLPSGAPKQACENLSPNHGNTSQPVKTNPYELVLDEFLDPNNGIYQYVPGVTYTGMLLLVYIQLIV